MARWKTNSKYQGKEKENKGVGERRLEGGSEIGKSISLLELTVLGDGNAAVGTKEAGPLHERRIGAGNAMHADCTNRRSVADGWRRLDEFIGNRVVEFRQLDNAVHLHSAVLEIDNTGAADFERVAVNSA
ncbi:hypothetical protein AYI68_g7291 [Smittium mucronatum]|uniref:Uncharacterized protein n=1 Tax=Smittium mucronatum TaxID=133383 RepID=A0A1R0GP42_9FUNG|nr:hypothetical protein AYI68_g7291 [Smittium mucronatum]